MSTLGYGGGSLTLPDALGGWPWLVGEEPPPLPDPAAAIDGALRRPDGVPALGTFVEPGDRVVVVVQKEIPMALRDFCVRKVEEVLVGAGCAAISWLEASGCSNGLPGCKLLKPGHRLGAAQVEQADQGVGGREPGTWQGPCAAFEPIGWVRGLGVARIAAPIRRADKLILIGVGSFDPIAGFGGGAQLVARGCANPATSLGLLLQGIETGPTLLQKTCGAVLDLLPPAFLIQLELQRGDRLAAVFAGDPRRAFGASTAFHRKWHERELGAPLDLIVASAGGAPNDRDLWAALPSLVAAAAALGPDGGLIFAAACPDGLGHPRSVDPEDGRISDLYLLAGILRRALGDRRCWIVSEGLAEFETSALGLSLAGDLETALYAARRAGIGFDRMAILEGSRTFPSIPSKLR